jgi:hypothetical protein
MIENLGILLFILFIAFGTAILFGIYKIPDLIRSVKMKNVANVMGNVMCNGVRS